MASTSSFTHVRLDVVVRIRAAAVNVDRD